MVRTSVSCRRTLPRGHPTITGRSGGGSCLDSLNQIETTGPKPNELQSTGISRVNTQSEPVAVTKVTKNLEVRIARRAMFRTSGGSISGKMEGWGWAPPRVHRSRLGKECFFCNEGVSHLKTMGKLTSASRTPPWLPSGWGCRGRRLSRGRRNPGRRCGFAPSLQIG